MVGHGHAGYQDALSRLPSGPVLADDQHGHHDRCHGVDLFSPVQHGDQPLLALPDGRPGDLEFRIDGDHRRLPDLPLGSKRHHAGAHALLGSRLAYRVPQPDRTGAQYGDRPVGADHLPRVGRLDRHRHRAGARHPHDQRDLDQHPPGNDQRTLSRRASDRGELRTGHILHHADLLAAGGTRDLDAGAAAQSHCSLPSTWCALPSSARRP